MKDPIPDGIAKGSVVTGEELDMMLNAYYEARGWSQTGLLTKKKILELELDLDHKGAIQ
jgi:aldehyde:ferredoxin oxidoreductase